MSHDLLEESQETNPSPRHPRERERLLVSKGPETHRTHPGPAQAAIYVGTGAVPVMSQRLRWTASDTGTYVSSWGVGAGLCALGPLGQLLKRNVVSDATAATLGALSLGAGALSVASGPPSTRNMWRALPSYVVGIALLRSSPAALLSKSAPSGAKGEALGLLDAAASACRVLVPLATGLISDAFGPIAPFRFQALLAFVAALALAAQRRPGQGPRARAPDSPRGVAAREDSKRD